jgi:AcrR family transcriptional regulator
VVVGRSGRRPGNQNTREAILDSAREAFGDRGYDGASIRQIATGAGVDPALVHHYFRTKEQLFLAVVQPPVDVADTFPKIFSGDIDGLGERLVRTFLGVWEGPVTGQAFRSLLRGAVSHPLTARLMREFFTTQVVRRASRALEGVVPAEEIPTRASFVASQLFGLATTRYILELDPLAGLPVEEVVQVVAPTLQRYLTGDLPLGTGA